MYWRIINRRFNSRKSCTCYRSCSSKSNSSSWLIVIPVFFYSFFFSPLLLLLLLLLSCVQLDFYNHHGASATNLKSHHHNQIDYYTSQHAIEKLARVEKEIAEAVDNYILVLEKRLEIAKRYKQDYDSSGISWDTDSDNNSTTNLPEIGRRQQSQSTSKGIVVKSNNDIVTVTSGKSLSAHPLRSFRLLRRFVTDLPRIEKELRSDEERKFLKLTEKVKGKLTFPSQTDIKGATEGILRVHDTYSININDFTSGNFFGLSTNASINAADCFFIGLYALNATIFTRAIEWLEQAYRMVTFSKDSSISRKDVREKLEEAISKHNEDFRRKSSNPYLFTRLISIEESLNPDDSQFEPRRRLLESSPPYVLRNPKSSLMDLTNFAALCAGKELRNITEIKKNSNGLRCYLDYGNKNIHYLLLPLKVERHSLSPLVLQLHDLIPAREDLNRILNTATTNNNQDNFMSRSEVHQKDHSKAYSSSRTSTSTFIKDEDENQNSSRNPIKSMMGRIYRRLEDFTGLKMSSLKGEAEDLQVSCYGIAGHFNPHLDTIFTSVDKRNFDKEELAKGDRLATFMFYLSDVERGGATAFPRIGVKVEPAKGSVLFWYNMDEFGNPNELTLHGGCPILLGNKCVANKWIRYNFQSNVKCSLKK